MVFSKYCLLFAVHVLASRAHLDYASIRQRVRQNSQSWWEVKPTESDGRVGASSPMRALIKLLKAYDLAAGWQVACGLSGLGMVNRELVDKRAVSGACFPKVLSSRGFTSPHLSLQPASCVRHIHLAWSQSSEALKRCRHISMTAAHRSRDNTQDIKASRDVAAMASELATEGFVVLDEKVQIDGESIEQLRQRGSIRLNDLLGKIYFAGGDPMEQWYMFNEIAVRQRHRWDFKMDPDDAVFNYICEAAVALAQPVIEHLHPPEDGAPQMRHMISSMLISRPGAIAQHWHADCDLDHMERAANNSDFRMYNLFVPLVDIARNSDGTQFWPKTHVEPMSFFAAVHPDTKPDSTVEAPACPAGGIIVSDFRTLHRGLPNIGRERHVAYFVVGIGDEVADNVNWCPYDIDFFPAEYFQVLPNIDDVLKRGDDAETVQQQF